MTDKYLELVNSGFTKKIASALGLPRPAKLRRQGFDATRVPMGGIVVVLGEGKDADTIANLLLQWDLMCAGPPHPTVGSTQSSRCSRRRKTPPRSRPKSLTPEGCCARWRPTVGS